MSNRFNLLDKSLFLSLLRSAVENQSRGTPCCCYTLKKILRSLAEMKFFAVANLTTVCFIYFLLLFFANFSSFFLLFLETCWLYFIYKFTTVDSTNCDCRPLGGGTVLKTAVSTAKFWGGLGDLVTPKKWKFRPILIMTWPWKNSPGPPLTSRSIWKFPFLA